MGVLPELRQEDGMPGKPARNAPCRVFSQDMQTGAGPIAVSLGLAGPYASCLTNSTGIEVRPAVSSIESPALRNLVTTLSMGSPTSMMCRSGS